MYLINVLLGNSGKPNDSVAKNKRDGEIISENQINVVLYEISFSMNDIVM